MKDEKLAGAAPDLTKAQRLAIGGAVAPVVRRQAAAPRKVTVVDKDGRPVRETTHVEVAKAVLARSEIEFSVQEGTKTTLRKCSCGVPFIPKARAARWCNSCRERFYVCDTCGDRVSDSTASDAAKADRSPRCKPCRRLNSTRQVAQAARSATVPCQCGAPLQVDKWGRHRALCDTCFRVPCRDCGVLLSVSLSKQVHARRRSGRPLPPSRCLRCHGVARRKARDTLAEAA